MKLGLTTDSVAANPTWLDSTEGMRFLVGGVTIDSAKVRLGDDGKRVVRSGTPIGKSGSKYRPAVYTQLAAAALSAATTIDVDDASGMVVGDSIVIGGTAKTIDSIDMGGGTGGSDRITLTAALGADKADNALVIGADVGVGVVGLLWETLDVTDGDAHGAVLDHGRVNAAAIPVDIHADVREALSAIGITFKS